MNPHHPSTMGGWLNPHEINQAGAEHLGHLGEGRMKDGCAIIHQGCGSLNHYTVYKSGWWFGTWLL